MAGLIPRDFIRELLDRVDIIDVIDARVPLKKKGANHSACCPFHQEKTPSFTASQHKQFFHCFGCGAHGNALDFVMEFDQLSFVDAIEDLAKSIGLEVPYEAVTPAKAAKAQIQKGLYDYLQQAQRFFQWQLRQNDGKVAITYLKNRGILGQTAKAFALGFAGPGWDQLMKRLGQNQADITALQQTGLLIENDQHRLYDRFRERIIFPIRDVRGRTLGFGGRTLDPDGIPKYLNSPETPVYQKGHHLYGLYEATRQRNQLNRLIVVEGYMDVIALVQHSLPEVVAALGTAFTQQQLRLLTKHSKHFIFCFDGDTAGQQAAWRALNVVASIMTGHYHVQFLFLPAGEDPDSLVQRIGSSGFEQYLSQAISFSDYLLQQYQQQHQTETLDGRAAMLTAMLPILRKIPQGGFLSLLLDHLAKLLHTSVEHISRQIIDHSAGQKHMPQMTHFSLAERALTYLIQHPDMAKEIAPPNALPSETAAQKLLAKLWLFLHQNTIQHTGGILAEWPDETEKALLAELAQIEFHLEPNKMVSELQGIANKLNQSEQHRALHQLIQQSKQRTLNTAEKQQLQTLLSRNKQ